MDSILDHLAAKEAIIGVDNSVLESLAESLGNADIAVRKLVLCSSTFLYSPHVDLGDQMINDETGSLFSEFMSALNGVSSLRTLIFVGHTFNSVVLSASFPESISTLVFDSKNKNNIDDKTVRSMNSTLKMELRMTSRL